MNKPPYIKIMDSGIDFILSCEPKPQAGKTMHLFENNQWTLATMDDLMDAGEDQLNVMITNHDGNDMDIAIFLADYHILGILKANKNKGVLTPVALVKTESCIIGTDSDIHKALEKLKGAPPSWHNQAAKHDASLENIIMKEEVISGETLDLTQEINVDKPAVYDGDPIDM